MYTSKTVIPLCPPVKRGVLHERRSVLFAFALPFVRGTTAYYLTICRGTFPRRPTARCSGSRSTFRPFAFRVYTLPRLTMVEHILLLQTYGQNAQEL